MNKEKEVKSLSKWRAFPKGKNEIRDRRRTGDPGQSPGKGLEKPFRQRNRPHRRPDDTKEQEKLIHKHCREKLFQAVLFLCYTSYIFKNNHHMDFG